MLAELLKYLSVYAVSTFKFLFGPLTAASLQLGFVASVAMTVAGMMTTVFVLSFAGARLRNKIMARFNSNRKLFTKRNRLTVKIWRRYGLLGVAGLTPVLFSPIIGTLLVISFGEKKERIVIYMFFSALFWASVLSAVSLYIGEQFFSS